VAFGPALAEAAADVAARVRPAATPGANRGGSECPRPEMRKGRLVRKCDLSEADPYYQAWQDYSRTWRRSIRLFVAFFFGGGAAAPLLVHVLVPKGPGWLPVLAAWLCMAAAILATIPPMRWRCPRCDKPFLSTTWAHNSFATRCLHCGLPKWAPRDMT